MPLSLDLSYLEVDIECPNCGYVTTVLYKQVMAEETIICNGCLREIHLIDEGNSLKHAERETLIANFTSYKEGSKKSEDRMVEIRDLRAKWQIYRQMLLRADYNQADEELARAMYFASNQPLISSICDELRHTVAYAEFDAGKWLEGRGIAGTIGAGRTNLGLALDERERAGQLLCILEWAVETYQADGDALGKIGMTTYAGSSTKLIDHIRNAVEVIFDPFYFYIRLFR